MAEMADVNIEGMDWLGYEDGHWPNENIEREDNDGPPITYITCRNCGEEGLIWKKINGNWRLFNENKIHTCKNNKEKKCQI